MPGLRMQSLRPRPPKQFSASSSSLAPQRRSETRVVNRLETIERARDRRQRIFKPRSAIEKHYAIGLGNTTFGEALLIGGIGRRSLRTQQEAFLARDLVQRGGNLLIGHGDGETFALAH